MIEHDERVGRTGLGEGSSMRTSPNRRWSSVVALGALLGLAEGCAPSGGSCGAELATTGPATIDLRGQNVECSGRSDNLSTFVDLGWRAGYTYIDVEYDDLGAGETGEFEALVNIEHRDDEWRGRCPSTIREHRLLGGSIWELRAEVRCATLSAGFGNDTDEVLTIAGGSFTYEGWHSRYEY